MFRQFFTTKSIPVRLCVLSLILMVPLSMGGCPEFRNATVDAVANATTSIVVGEEEQDAALQSAGVTIITAAIDLLFDQLRTDSAS